MSRSLLKIDDIILSQSAGVRQHEDILREKTL